MGSLGFLVFYILAVATILPPYLASASPASSVALAILIAPSFIFVAGVRTNFRIHLTLKENEQ